jgi:hypothetical protein
MIDHEHESHRFLLWGKEPGHASWLLPSPAKGRGHEIVVREELESTSESRRVDAGPEDLGGRAGLAAMRWAGRLPLLVVKDDLRVEFVRHQVTSYTTVTPIAGIILFYPIPQVL